GRASVLVATDIAARGIDIDQLPFVVNYELPYTPEDYVHRIGRTGRAGTPGEAIAFMSPEEGKALVEVEKLLKRTIPKLDLPAGFDGEDRQSRSSSGHAREERPSRGARPAERESHAPRGARPVEREREHRPHTKPHAVHKQPAASDFDFSKPYEPAQKSADAPAETPAAASHRGRPKRPTAALLGGTTDPRKSHK
ncbi:MAG TPA: helicase-related protein, partial [Burkholderiales bacterium]|nr:helicase-related protein [Burkholderiales bacterium]